MKNNNDVGSTDNKKVKMLDKFVSEIKKGKFGSLLILGAIGFVLLVAGGIMSINEKNKNAYLEADSQNTQSIVTDTTYSSDTKRLTDEYREDLRKRLEGILSQVNGAGNVHVEIMFLGTVETKYAKSNDIQEKNTEESSNGTSKKSKETNKTDDVILTSPASSMTQSPIKIGEEVPEITGVVVVASGAKNVQVKIDMAKACETLLGIASHKVVVLAGK